MKRSTQALFVFLTCCVLIVAMVEYGCRDSSPISPPATFIDRDTCGNKHPVSAYDSVFGYWAPFVYSIERVYRSRDGLLAGLSFVYGLNGIPYLQQSFIYDPAAARLVGTYGGWVFGGWSQDGKRLLFEDGFDGISVLNYETGIRTKVVGAGDHPRWSPDDKWIYFNKGGSCYKVRPAGVEMQLVAENMGDAVPLDDHRIIRLSDSGLVVFDTNEKRKTFLEFSRIVPPDRLSIPSYWDLSPDRMKILADHRAGNPFTNVNRTGVGLYLYDMSARTVRRVLPGQYWYNVYRPVWTSNSTFFASWYCSCDSTEMVHEYDLNGRVLKQITFKHMKLY